MRYTCSVFPFFSSHEVFPYFRGEKKREESSTSGPPPTTFFPCILTKRNNTRNAFFPRAFFVFRSSEALKMSVTLFLRLRAMVSRCLKTVFLRRRRSKSATRFDKYRPRINTATHTFLCRRCCPYFLRKYGTCSEECLFCRQHPFCALSQKVCKAPDKETSQLNYEKRRLTT